MWLAERGMVKTRHTHATRMHGPKNIRENLILINFLTTTTDRRFASLKTRPRHGCDKASPAVIWRLDMRVFLLYGGSLENPVYCPEVTE